MLLAIQQTVGHIIWSYDGDCHESCDLFARTTQTKADLQAKYPTAEDVPYIFWVDMSVTIPKNVGIVALNDVYDMLRNERNLFKIVDSNGRRLSILNFTKGWTPARYRKDSDVIARSLIKATIDNSESTTYLVSIQFQTSSALSEETYSLEFNSDKILEMNLVSEEVDASAQLSFVSSSIPLLHGRYQKLVTVDD